MEVPNSTLKCNFACFVHKWSYYRILLESRIFLLYEVVNILQIITIIVVIIIIIRILEPG